MIGVLTFMGSPSVSAPDSRRPHRMERLSCRSMSCGEVTLVDRCTAVVRTRIRSYKTRRRRRLFLAALKNARVHRTVYPTRARADVARYIEFWYNRNRLHSGLGYKSPQEVLNEWTQHQQAA